MCPVDLRGPQIESSQSLGNGKDVALEDLPPSRDVRRLRVSKRLLRAHGTLRDTRRSSRLSSARSKSIDSPIDRGARDQMTSQRDSGFVRVPKEGRSMSSPTSLPTSFANLASSLDGRLITPDDDSYDAVRRVFLGDVDPRPAAIARVANANDVARVVGFALDRGVDLAVRAGGHSMAGHSSGEGGLVLDVRDLTTIEVDRDTRTVWAGAGLTALDLTTATAHDGLAVGFGDTGSVGIAGITLGGGIGYMVRRHGLTIDSLLAAEIVTADGELRRVDAHHEPDLFWAIRGGGGNFGVATRFRYRVHDVRGVVGGMLILPATPDTVAGFIEAAEAAPEALSAIANVMPAPPMPFLSPEQHGKLVIFAFIVHLGDVEAGQRAMAPFRALATPIADMLHAMAYPEIYPPEDPNYRPTPIQHTMFLDHVDRATAKTIVDFLEASDASLRVAQLRVLGGAMARVPADATAFAHRSSRILAVLVNFYDGTAEDRARRQHWVDEFASAVDQGVEGAYVNFLADEGAARVREAYPGKTWDRLVEIKRRYDPTNLFRRNQNIPASG
jgi:FAD/FMN-containing dehydrogenase